jgi:hypothetical protein
MYQMSENIKSRVKRIFGKKNEEAESQEAAL